MAVSLVKHAISLQDLAYAAECAGFRPEIVNTGGGVMAVEFARLGEFVTMTLDGGQQQGTTWKISTAMEDRATAESDDFPVYSDADQTLYDGLGWITAVSGWNARHGDAVRHFVTGDRGTVVGDFYNDGDGDTMVSVVWDDAPEYTDTMGPGQLRMATPRLPE